MTTTTTTIDHLVESVRRAGASVRSLGDGRFSLLGSVPEDVLTEIRANRDEFLEAWEEDRRHRYLRCPPNDHPLRAKPPHWRADVRRRIDQYALRQGPEVGRWVLLRASAYRDAHAEDWTDAQATNAAMDDLLHWQFADRHPDPESVLATFDEVLRC